MRQCQALIDAYVFDGWRGASKDKLKPTAELSRAREKIFNCKLKIRELFKGLELDPNEREITTVEDEFGEVDVEDIFCSKCALADDRDDDDILLCDGFCDRAYHQSCVVPPVANEDIPPDDEGWLCPLCDARVDVIYVLNDEYDQNLGQKCVAEDVFKEEAEMEMKGIVPGTAQFEHADEEDWPSDESDDEDFDKAQMSDDGRDDEHEALSGSARSSSEESSSEEEDLIIDGPRRRTKVDYVKLNGEMFGAGEAYEGEFEERGGASWKSSNKSKAEMLAAIRGDSVGKSKGDKKSQDKKSKAKDDDAKSRTRTKPQGRRRFDPHIVAELERIFLTGATTPKKPQRETIASNLHLDADQVKIWFMNRRRKASKEPPARAVRATRSLGPKY